MGFYETQEANYEYRKSMRESCDEGYEAGYKQGKADALEIRSVLKRGKWIHHEGGYSDHYECTACGKAIVLTRRWKFCPNCGADMRGEAE